MQECDKVSKRQKSYLESWLSGRKHLTANEAGSKSPRGFESLTLRTVGHPKRDPNT